MYEQLKNQVEPDPYLLEVIAIAERALNFAYSGNPKVLARKIMDPMWVSLSLVHTGWPTFYTPLSINGHQISLSAKEYPYNHTSGYPLMASSRVIEVTYGDQVAKVCCVLFCANRQRSIRAYINNLTKLIYLLF